MVFKDRGLAHIAFLRTEFNYECHQIVFPTLVSKGFNLTFSFSNFANNFEKQFTFELKYFIPFNQKL